MPMGWAAGPAPEEPRGIRAPDDAASPGDGGLGVFLLPAAGGGSLWLFAKRDTHFPAFAAAQLQPAWEAEAAGLWGWS